jgi:hypothetical protein
MGFGLHLADILDWVAGSYDEAAFERAAEEIDVILYKARGELPPIWDTRRQRAGVGEPADEDYVKRSAERRERIADKLRELAAEVERGRHG